MGAKSRQREQLPHARQRGAAPFHFEDADGDPLSWAASRLRVQPDVRLLPIAEREVGLLNGGDESDPEALEDALCESCRPPSLSSSKFLSTGYADFTVVTVYSDVLFLIAIVVLVGILVAAILWL